LKGVEDLGGGLQAIFALESGFGVDTGIAGQGCSCSAASRGWA
jgi:predicted porin